MKSIVAVGLAIAFASEAAAEGAIDLGGKLALTASFSASSHHPDTGGDRTTIALGSTLSKTTADARWEYGAGILVVAALSDFGDATRVTPSGQLRINSDLLGPAENVVLYAGFIAGLIFVDIEGRGREEIGAFGPKLGAEYYFSSNAALQLEDTVVVDTDSGVVNNLTLGIKLLF